MLISFSSYSSSFFHFLGIFHAWTFLFTGYTCSDFINRGHSSSNYDYYCYQSQYDNQEFCIGQHGSSNDHHQCTDINGGIRFVFNHPYWPMRFNKAGKTFCQNYSLNHLQNLARSLGYINYRVNVKKRGNSCNLAWLDSKGHFRSSYGSIYNFLPYDVEFWN